MSGVMWFGGFCVGRGEGFGDGRFSGPVISGVEGDVWTGGTVSGYGTIETVIGMLFHGLEWTMDAEMHQWMGDVTPHTQSHALTSTE